MQPSFVISIPTDEPELREEIEEQLSNCARVNETPRTMNLDEIKLIVEIIAGGTTIAANVAAVVTFLLALKDRFKKQGKPSGIRIAVPGKGDVALDAIDEAILKRMMGGEQ